MANYNISLEQFYKEIEKRLLFIGAYIDNKALARIFVSCRLKPISVFREYKQNKSLHEKLWIDEFGQVVRIENKKIKLGKQIKFVQNKTDLFRNESFTFLLERSKRALIAINDENCFILLQGTDNYFRTFDKDQQPISSLTLGFEALTLFLSEKTAFKQLSFQEDKGFSWFTFSLPFDRTQNETLGKLLYGAS